MKIWRVILNAWWIWLFSASATAQEEWRPDVLVDKGIKTARVETFTRDSIPMFTRNYHFDTYGRIKKTVTYDKDRATSAEKFAYDDKGNILEELKIFYASPGDSILVETRYTYDDRGNVIQKKQVNNLAGTTQITRYDIEYTGTYATSVVVYEHNNIIERMEQRYDENGFLLEKVIYRGNQTIREVYTWDEKGRQREIIQYINDVLNQVTSWQYDDAGNMRLKESIWYNRAQPASIARHLRETYTYHGDLPVHCKLQVVTGEGMEVFKNYRYP